MKARQEILGNDKKNAVLSLLIHGDAAFSGQGVVTETLNMSQLTGYKTGGTIHLVINNQIGYTTLPEHARSTRYATDVAKMLMVPIFHVHGEDPEAVVHVVRLAVDYRKTFNKDVVIDLICFRKYGHNEGDEPYFTQPQMYERIRSRPSLNTVYSQKLLEQGLTRQADVDVLEQNINQELEDALETVRSSACVFPQTRFHENWKNFNGRYTHDPLETGVSGDKLVALAQKLNMFPADFSANTKLVRLLKNRLDSVKRQGYRLGQCRSSGLCLPAGRGRPDPFKRTGQRTWYSAQATCSLRHKNRQ